MENAVKIAKELGLKLAREGLALRETHNDLRKTMALNDLAQENASITETAYLLGYPDLSAFTRAFKTWTGITPSRFRNNA